MSHSRREFIKASAAASAFAIAGGLGTRGFAAAHASGIHRRAKLRILVLGGTGFLGPAVVDAAKARGHDVTLFNRGRREKYVGSPDGVEKLYGNRDPLKFAHSKVVDGKDVDDETSPKGLKELEGKKWDAVIDNSGYVPRIVKASAELLAPNVGQYLFISSISVYKNNDKPNKDESDEIGVMKDPTVEEMGSQFENYGPLKALCEQAAEKAMPGRVTNIRPGYIVGPRDTSDRFTYWPVRVSKGGEVLVPGTPQDIVQIIDVRDLAEFMVRCVENKTFGIFNATGPAKPLTHGETMAACLAASKATGGKADATFTYVPWEWLKNAGLPPGTLPILLPGTGDEAGFHSRDVSKAIKAGLKFRTPQETCEAILKWWPEALALRAKVDGQQRDEAKRDGKPERPAAPTGLRTGIPQDKEQEILAKWTADPTRTEPKDGGKK